MQMYVAERGDREAVGPNFLTLGELRKRFADRYENGVYRFRDPNGVVHVLSLDRWKDRDPDTTYLQIGFRFKRMVNSAVGKKSLFP